RGEYEITDAIQGLIDEGKLVVPVEASGWWKDTGKPEDILDANRLELLELCGKVEGRVEDSELVGDVRVDKGAFVQGSRIVGPVIIGADARIENAYVGPYTSIGRGVVVKDSEIEYSVVEQGTRIEQVRVRIQGSLIGANVVVCGNARRPQSHELILGDQSRLLLSS
ncbi:MAG TPA: sugar phosphate nucleotidyltransferase, partial [Trueperaceae bacterium]